MRHGRRFIRFVAFKRGLTLLAVLCGEFRARLLSGGVGGGGDLAVLT